MTEETYLFVYGTLRPPRSDSQEEDSRYYHQVENYIRESRPATLPNATLYNMGTYPAARPGEAEIHGDLLHLDPAALAIIDRIEGHPVFYYRERVIVKCEGEQVEAWIYWAPDGLEHAGALIPSGDWFARSDIKPSVAAEVISETIEAGADPDLVAQFQRLAEAEAVWLTTVRRDRRPHSTPVWHGWHHGRLYVVAKPSSVKIANLQDNPGVVVTLPDPLNVIVVEGWATIVPGMREAIRPLFKQKYDWDIGTDLEYRSIIEITPYKLLAWGSKGEGRWTAPDIFSIDE